MALWLKSSVSCSICHRQYNTILFAAVAAIANYQCNKCCCFFVLLPTFGCLIKFIYNEKNTIDISRTMYSLCIQYTICMILHRKRKNVWRTKLLLYHSFIHLLWRIENGKNQIRNTCNSNCEWQQKKPAIFSSRNNKKAHLFQAIHFRCVPLVRSFSNFFWYFDMQLIYSVINVFHSNEWIHLMCFI